MPRRRAAGGRARRRPAWGTARRLTRSVAEQDEDERERRIPRSRSGALERAVESPQDEVEPEPLRSAAPQLAIELSQEHAAGDLQIPDGYAVLEGVGEGGRRAVGLVVSRFNGEVTSAAARRARSPSSSAAGVRQRGRSRSWSCRARSSSRWQRRPSPRRAGSPASSRSAASSAATRRTSTTSRARRRAGSSSPRSRRVSRSRSASSRSTASSQAEPRIEKGAEAVRSALEMADLFSQLRAAASR